MMVARRAPPNPFVQPKATTARILHRPLIIAFLVTTSIFPTTRNLLCNTPPNTHLYLAQSPASSHISTTTLLITVITVSDSNISVTAINRPCNPVPNSPVFPYQNFHWKIFLHPKPLRILSHASAHPRRWSTPHLPRQQHPRRRSCLLPTARQVQLRTRPHQTHSRIRGALAFPMRVPTCGNNLALLLTIQSACGLSLIHPLARSPTNHTRCSSNSRSTAALLDS